MSRMTQEQVDAHQKRVWSETEKAFHVEPRAKHRPRPNTALISQAVAAKAKKSKFKNIRVFNDAGKFDSKWEAERYQQLQLLEKAGEIRDLRAQVSFSLMANDEQVGSYVADAVYFDVKLNRKVVEDAKGCKTPLYRWKARHFRAQYGFAITEVKRS